MFPLLSDMDPHTPASRGFCLGFLTRIKQFKLYYQRRQQYISKLSFLNY